MDEDRVEHKGPPRKRKAPAEESATAIEVVSEPRPKKTRPMSTAEIAGATELKRLATAISRLDQPADVKELLTVAQTRLQWLEQRSQLDRRRAMVAGERPPTYLLFTLEYLVDTAGVLHQLQRLLYAIDPHIQVVLLTGGFDAKKQRMYWCVLSEDAKHVADRPLHEQQAMEGDMTSLSYANVDDDAPSMRNHPDLGPLVSLVHSKAGQREALHAPGLVITGLIADVPQIFEVLQQANFCVVVNRGPAKVVASDSTAKLCVIPIEAEPM